MRSGRLLGRRRIVGARFFLVWVLWALTHVVVDAYDAVLAAVGASVTTGHDVSRGGIGVAAAVASIAYV